ncbi:hypothetical protein DP113_26440 [Brasilonema octagenarum UFV-E1]|uniref:Uncharacterized protein n=2 Tax=Brasilonema TaxID=383614 RepID=A0A856MKV1_9CYAN|nr:hypothetical protein [Brasilonema octagenarum UFV-OR1]QDL10989.1 hypothetical protein DP114_26515 [Brasilonema sennae CENA114]QDL17335.1 hypothetical protein DP113_26440 [Brasilonema octagenarum UFV-E1]
MESFSLLPFCVLPDDGHYYTNIYLYLKAFFLHVFLLAAIEETFLVVQKDLRALFFFIWVFFNFLGFDEPLSTVI